MDIRDHMKRIYNQLMDDMDDERSRDRFEWITIICSGVVGSALVWWVKHLGG